MSARRRSSRPHSVARPIKTISTNFWSRLRPTCGPRAAKRAFDLALAAFALLLTAPLQALAALAIIVSMGRPVLFRQQRPGLNGQPFELIKFRTMVETVEGVEATSDADRLTPVGRVLRSTSLDELPTLWNILKGDMSIVGPRPLLMAYLERYTEVQARRHEVRPGLTGLAQVNGRNELTWDEKFSYDTAYVDSHSMGGDIKIIARTFLTVLKREGISAHNSATMPEFLGGTE